MKDYTKFADIYTTGSYPRYSEYVANKLPDILGKLSYRPVSILDLACGEGTFALEASGLGYDVTGVDKSLEMIKIARQKVEGADVDAEFFQGDMRKFSLPERFDLITSWFDSMNYLLEKSDFRATLENAYSMLEAGGYFVFDVNTIHGLSVQWQEEGCYVQRDDKNVFEVHRTDYDGETRIAKLNITFFVNDGETWKKYEETHREKAYELEEIEQLARETGFEIISIWSDIDQFSPPDEKSGRVWFALGKE